MNLQRLSFIAIDILLLMTAATLQLTFCETSTSAPCSSRERDALLKFKRHAVENNPAGYNWLASPPNARNSTGADAEAYDCCKWKGVYCGMDGAVVEIDLNNCDGVYDKWISGVIKPEAIQALATMTDLSSLDLSCQHFHGSIPAEMGNLTSLTYIDLSHNLFSQEIPSSLFQLPSVFNLDLSQNNFSGTIPDAFTNKSKIVYLFLNDNQLTGYLPQSMQYLTSIEDLELGANQFSSQTVPSVLFHLTSLVILNISCNRFIGAIPEAFKNLTNMESLDLSYNQFFPQEIPSFLFQMPYLGGLYLSHNNFIGTIPDMDAFTNNSNRASFSVELDLSHNCLDGLLPLSMQHIDPLTSLRLNNNQFSDQSIPSTLLLLPQLVYLDLSCNNFTGISFASVSHKIDNTSHNYLSFVNLSSNKLTGSIFEGANFPLFENLAVLDLSDNKLEGPFPESMADLIPNLLLLKMDNNHLRGSIPSFIRHLKQLMMLDLGSNELNGSIPDWIGSSLSERLKVLVLTGNGLTGNIPGSLALLRRMQHLEYNNTDYKVLSVPIMTKDQNRYVQFDFLTALDLSENQLSGPIPPELGKLKGLVSLNLSRNHLNGEIPSTLGNLTNLESLDLSSNMLQGHIPSSFNDLNNLAVVNLSSNRLSGSIPSSPHWLDTFEGSIFLDNDGLCSTNPNALSGLSLCGSPIGDSSTTGISVLPGSKTLYEGIVEWVGFVVGYPVGFLSGGLLLRIRHGRHGILEF